MQPDMQPIMDEQALLASKIQPRKWMICVRHNSIEANRDAVHQGDDCASIRPTVA